MYGVIVATHGNYASGLKSTVNLVCGEMENLRTIDYVAEISVTDLENKYDEAMAELKAYDKIIILTLGMSPLRLWLTVKAPLAFPLAFSGVRTAASEIIASATLAAYIGAGGLGILIYTGLGALRNDLLWIGGISVAMLSLIVNRVLAMVDRRIRAYERAGSSAR